MIDAWIKEKIRLQQNEVLTREAIEAYQLRQLRSELVRIKENSPFYARTLAGIDPLRDINKLEDLSKLPFSDEKDLIYEGNNMICVRASDVNRIVTLPTSGTTGDPKRVHFTEADQELMIDYIHHGLRIMTGPGEVFMILMPCERPGSVGDLVRIGLERMGVTVIPVGVLPFDGSRDDEILTLMHKKRVNAMLATASSAARLAEKSVASPFGAALKESMHAVLLSAEYVSDRRRTQIEQLWQCLVYEHYGMTEMGLGGAMACEARVGYHPREADLIFEVVDPESGKALPDGEMGELVFTTLTRTAMPLIRYRTGDFTRWMPGDCPCGSVLKRLARVGDRRIVKGY